MISKIIASVVVVLAAGAGVALAATQPASADGRQVSANQINGLSRLGGLIAFEAADGLYVVNAAGGEPRRIPSSRPGDGNPRWSPNGKQLAFDRRANGNWDVYVMNVDGSDQRQLTFSPADDDFAMWAPHGRSLVFNSQRDKDWLHRRSVYVVTIATGAARRVTRDGKYPDWSSNGRIIFVGGGSGDQDVFTVRPYGSDRRQLGSIEAIGVRVSHDATRIVYERQDSRGSLHGQTANLYTAQIDGTHIQPLAASAEWEGDPNWSPDDDSIVFESSGYRGGPFSVYTVESDGGARTRLTATHGCCADWGITPAG